MTASVALGTDSSEQSASPVNCTLAVRFCMLDSLDIAEFLPGLQRSGTWCSYVHMIQCICAALHVQLLHLSMASGTCYSLQNPEQEGRVDNMCAFGTAAVMCRRH